MAFKKIERSFGNNKEISGFWSRLQGEAIVGKVTTLVDTINVKYPFYLIELTEDCGTIIHGDQKVKGKTGMLVGVSAGCALRPLEKLIGQKVRITSTGDKEITFKDEKGRRKPGIMHDFDIEVDSPDSKLGPFTDDTPF
jgi:hypothetical protein